MNDGFNIARPRPGAHPLPQDVVEVFKRERVATSLSEVVHEVGLPRLSVLRITERARMARSTFYELFANREEALRYALELGAVKLRSAVEAAADRPGPWERRVRAVLGALLEVSATEPYLIELSLVHGPGSPFVPVPFDRDLVESLAGILRAGRAGGARPGPPPRVEEMLAYGTLAVIAYRLRRDEAASLPGLGEELVQLTTMPFGCPPP